MGSLEALTTAVEANTKAMETLAKIYAGVKGGTSTPSAEAAPAEAEKGRAGRPAKKDMTPDQFQEPFLKWMKEAPEGSDLAEARSKALKSILNVFGVKKVSMVEPGSYAKALKMLDEIKAKEAAAEADGEGEDDGDLI